MNRFASHVFLGLPRIAEPVMFPGPSTPESKHYAGPWPQFVHTDERAYIDEHHARNAGEWCVWGCVVEATMWDVYYLYIPAAMARGVHMLSVNPKQGR